MSSPQNNSSGSSDSSDAPSGSFHPLGTSDRLPIPIPAPANPLSGNSGRFAFSFHFPGLPATVPGVVGTGNTTSGIAEAPNGGDQPPPLTITMEFGFGPPQPSGMDDVIARGGGEGIGARVQEGAPGFRMEGREGGNSGQSPFGNQPSQIPTADQAHLATPPDPAPSPFSLPFGPPPTLPGAGPQAGINPFAFLPFTPNADGNPQTQFNLPWLFFQQAAGLRRPAPPDPARAQELLKGLKDPGADMMRRIDRVVKAETDGEDFKCAVCMEGWEEDAVDTQSEVNGSGDVTMERQPSLASEGSMESEREVEKVVFPSVTKDSEEEGMDPEGGRTGMKVLPCCHLFHTDCLEPWLRSKTTCPTCRFDIDPLSTTLRRRTDSNRARFNPLRPQATQSTNAEQRGRPYAARPTNSGVDTPNAAANDTATPADGPTQPAESGGMFGPRDANEPLFSFFHPLQPERPATPEVDRAQPATSTEPTGASATTFLPQVPAATGSNDFPSNANIPSTAESQPTGNADDPPLLATFHFSLIPEPLVAPPHPANANAPSGSVSDAMQQAQTTSNTNTQPAATAHGAASNASPPVNAIRGGFDVPTAFLLALRTANRIMSNMGGPAGAMAFANQHAAQGGNGAAPLFGAAQDSTTAAAAQSGPVPAPSNASPSGLTGAQTTLPSGSTAPAGPSMQLPQIFGLFGNALPNLSPVTQARSPSADGGRAGATATPAAGGPGSPHRNQSPPSRERKKWVPPTGKLTLDEWVTLREKALHWRCDHPICMFAPPERLDDVLPGEWDDWKPTNEACIPLISMGQKHVAPSQTDGAFNLLACGHSFHTSCVRIGALSADWWTKDEDGRRLCRCPRCRKEGWIEEPDAVAVEA